MGFIQKIISSIYDPVFYRKVPSVSGISTFLYYLLLSFLLALITVLAVAPTMLSQVNGFVNEVPDQLVESYPDELQVAIINGEVSTNVPEPFFIPLPQTWREDTKNSDYSGENLVVIDTKTPFSAEQFNKYNAIAWLMKDSIILGGDSQTRIVDLSEFENVVITKSKVTDIVDQVKPWLKYIAPALLFFMGIIFMMFSLFTLVYLLLLALVFWIILKILKINISYGSMYKITIYSVTLSLIANAVLTIARNFVEIPVIPFQFTFLAVAVFGANILMHRELWKKTNTTKTSSKK